MNLLSKNIITIASGIGFLIGMYLIVKNPAGTAKVITSIGGGTTSIINSLQN